MIHIYTGEGKGKTTSAFGLAMRASGQGLKVCVFQFWKQKTLILGEEISAKKLKNIKVVKCEKCHPMFIGHKDTKTPGHREELEKDIEAMVKKAEKAILSKKYNMIILDEIVNVVDQGYFDKDEFLRFLKNTPEGIELVLTGRGNISEMEDLADYITVMTEKKHPFRVNIKARKGIEY
ncbi:MAG: cob(I)yrinic acid a,c-diamide adenosyltransferase [Candidatus Omnitrophota bacterium]